MTGMKMWVVNTCGIATKFTEIWESEPVGCLSEKSHLLPTLTSWVSPWNAHGWREEHKWSSDPHKCAIDTARTHNHTHTQDMARWLQTHTALSEDPKSVSSYPCWVIYNCNCSSREPNTFFWNPCGHTLSPPTQTRIICNLKNNKINL